MIIGNASYIMPGLSNDFSTEIEIGHYTSIARNLTVLVGPQAQHPQTVFPRCVSNFPFAPPYPQVRDQHPYGKLTIGSDVWIGTNVIITSKSDITIHHGAIVGAGSVITKDVPPFSIVAGNPAKHIKNRYHPAVIDVLLEIAWWNWPYSKVLEAISDMVDIDRFLEKHMSSIKE